MSDYKISIIMPVFNGEKYIRDSFESIISQSIGFENIEVVVVNDASTDNTKFIIDEYASKYPNFKAYHLQENIGAAYGPRNIAISKASSDYLMFLDADDTFTKDACKVLYDEISKSNADMVFGRYYRVYDNIKLESYSPYTGDDNDIKINPNFKGITSFIWSKIIFRILYGKKKLYNKEITTIRDNPELLKILPSIWTKIVKKSSVNKFPDLITGEDLNFILDVYNEGKILFLNDKFITNYFMRFEGDLSITKNIKFQLILDSIRSYKIAIIKSNEYNFKDYNKMINPFLLNYINLLRQANLTDDEKEILENEITQVNSVYKNKGFIGKFLVWIIKILSR